MCFVDSQEVHLGLESPKDLLIVQLSKSETQNKFKNFLISFKDENMRYLSISICFESCIQTFLKLLNCLSLKKAKILINQTMS